MVPDHKYSSISPTQSFLSRSAFSSANCDDPASLKDPMEIETPARGCYCGYERAISQLDQFPQLKKNAPAHSSMTPPKGRRSTLTTPSRPATPTPMKSKHQKSQSISIITPHCADCSSKVKTLIEARKNLSEAAKTLYPYRTASYSVQAAQREKELMYQNAGRSIHIDKLSQDVLAKSIELNDLTKSVAPKLKREKQFGSTFDRKKDDVVLSQDQFLKIREMVLNFKFMEEQFIKFANQLRGTHYELKDPVTIPEIFEFLVGFFALHAQDSSPASYPVTFLNSFSVQNCKSGPAQSTATLQPHSIAEESEGVSASIQSFSEIDMMSEEPSFSMINEAPLESIKSFTESVKAFKDRTNLMSPQSSNTRYFKKEASKKAHIGKDKFVVNIDEDDLIVVDKKNEKAPWSVSEEYLKPDISVNVAADSDDENQTLECYPFGSANFNE